MGAYMPIVVYILGVTIFSLTTSEFMVAGIMQSLSDYFEVTAAQVGYLITHYAIGMVIGGPVLTMMILRMKIPNKTALIFLLIVYGLIQAIVASSTSYEAMAFFRLMSGVAGAACFGIALAICTECVDVELRAKASSVVIGGLMLATVVGVPIATIIDQKLGWRASFWSVSILTLLCTIVASLTVPKTKNHRIISFKEEIFEFKNKNLWAAYFTSSLIIGSTFSAFSYFSNILSNVSGLSNAIIPWVFSVYGVSNVIGNAVVGRYADKYAISIMFLGLTILTFAMIALNFFAYNTYIAILLITIIGLVGVPMNPAMISRVMNCAYPGALVNTVHTSFINIGLAIGTWLGGWVISSGYGFLSPLWVGSALAILGIVTLLPFIKR